MTDVFISYKREERDKIVLIADRLRALGLDVWFDARLTTGHHFDREIDQHVRKAGCVLVCWSEGALSSEWVRAEAAIGRERGVLVPLMVDQCSPPVPFNTLQTENVIGWAGEADHEGWLRAVDQIAGLVQRPEIAQTQRERGQSERDLRRTQALLEAQRREEEDAQRRAAAAANRRAELEAQLAQIAPAPQARPAYAAMSSSAPSTETIDEPPQRLSLRDLLLSYVGLSAAAILLTLMLLASGFSNDGVFHGGALFAALGAFLGVAIATWLRIRREARGFRRTLRHFLLQFVLVTLAACLAIAILDRVISGGWLANPYSGVLMVSAFFCALAFGMVLRLAAPYSGPLKRTKGRSAMAAAVANVFSYLALIWIGSALAWVCVQLASQSSSRALVTTLSLIGGAAGVEATLWLRQTREARSVNRTPKHFLLQWILISTATASALVANLSLTYEETPLILIASFAFAAALRFLVPIAGAPRASSAPPGPRNAVPWIAALVLLLGVTAYDLFAQGLIVRESATEAATEYWPAEATTEAPTEAPPATEYYDAPPAMEGHDAAAQPSAPQPADTGPATTTP